MTSSVSMNTGLTETSAWDCLVDVCFVLETFLCDILLMESLAYDRRGKNRQRNHMHMTPKLITVCRSHRCLSLSRIKIEYIIERIDYLNILKSKHLASLLRTFVYWCVVRMSSNFIAENISCSKNIIMRKGHYFDNNVFLVTQGRRAQSFIYSSYIHSWNNTAWYLRR